ncbi:MAG: hypothetical protein FWF37_01575 [Chloroflexi bacterium]|nr:hypothetical protein [Chloroflexota bacterium]
MKSKISKIFGVVLSAAMLLTMAVVPAASAGTHRWTEFPLPSKENFQLADFVIDYFITEGAACDDGAIFAVATKTWDNGAPVGNPANNFTPGKIFKSVDGGKNWTLYIDAADILSWGSGTNGATKAIASVALSSLDANTIYITDGGNIFKSSDNGVNWVKFQTKTTYDAQLYDIEQIVVGYRNNNPYMIIAASAVPKAVDNVVPSLDVFVMNENSTNGWVCQNINTQRPVDQNLLAEPLPTTTNQFISFAPVAKIYKIAVDSNFATSGAVSVFYQSSNYNIIVSGVSFGPYFGVAVTSANVVDNWQWNTTYKDEVIFAFDGDSNASNIVANFWLPKDWEVSDGMTFYASWFDQTGTITTSCAWINALISLPVTPTNTYVAGLYKVVTNGNTWNIGTTNHSSNFATISNLAVLDTTGTSINAAKVVALDGITVNGNVHLAVALDDNTAASSATSNNTTTTYYANVDKANYTWLKSEKAPAPAPGKVNDIAFDYGFNGAGNRQFIIATTNHPSNLPVANSGAGVYLTENSGETFVGIAFLQIDLSNPTINDMATDGSTAFFIISAGGKSYLWKQNGGWALINWSDSKLPVFDKLFVSWTSGDVFVWNSVWPGVPADPGMEIYRSTNCGATFTAFSSNVPGEKLFDFVSIDDANYYAISDSGVYHATAIAHAPGPWNGVAYSTQASATNNANNALGTYTSGKVSFLGDTIVIAVKPNGAATLVIASVDGGTTFKQITSFASIEVNGVQVVSANSFFLAYTNSGVGGLDKLTFTVPTSGSNTDRYYTITSANNIVASYSADAAGLGTNPANAPSHTGYDSMVVSNGFAYAIDTATGLAHRWNGTVDGGSNRVETISGAYTLNGTQSDGPIKLQNLNLTVDSNNNNVLWAISQPAVTSGSGNTAAMAGRIFVYTDTLINETTGVTVSNITTNSATITWDKITNATQYRVVLSTGEPITDLHTAENTITNDSHVLVLQYAQKADGSFNGTNRLTAETANFNSNATIGTDWNYGLRSDTTYYVTVFALNPLSNLANVAAITKFTTNPGPVDWMRSTYTNNQASTNPVLNWGKGILGNLQFIWDGSTGDGYANATYWVQVATDINFNNIVVQKDDLTLNYYEVTTKLNYDTSYFWRVCYKTTGDWGAWKTSFFETRSDTVPVNNNNVSAPSVSVNNQLPSTDTPAYIWVIIAIGAILTIAVIVLIVRTRKTD